MTSSNSGKVSEGDLNEIEELFDKIKEEFISKKTARTDIELISRPDPTEVKILFDEIYRSISSGDKTSAKNLKKLLTSEQRSLYNKDIEAKALATAKIVRVVETERKKKAELARKIKAARLADQKLLLRPSLKDRLTTILIDLALNIILLGALTLLGLLILYPNILFEALTNFPDDKKIYPLLKGVLVATLPLSWSGYYIYWLLRRGQTPGQKCTATVLVSPLGEQVKTSQYFIRGVLMPLSTLLGGFITAILGSRSPADFVANTRTIQEYSSFDEEEKP